MVSDKQLEANKQNAKLGGVKTPEGKEVSKYNALKHGILCKEVLLNEENEDELIDLGKQLRAELKPSTEIERFLTERVISNIWRLKRTMRAEKEMIEERLEEVDFMTSKKETLGKVFSKDFINYDSFGKFSRYETSIENGIFRALHELQSIQSPNEEEES